MKTYTNKSNAARAAKSANGGNLDGLVLMGSEGAWYYAPAPKPKAVPKAPSAPKAAAKGKPAPTAPAKPRKAATEPQGRLPGETVYSREALLSAGGKLYVIDKDRPTKHGITRPSAGTIGGRLWAVYEAIAKSERAKPHELPVATVKAHELASKYNANKVMIEFYRWRRFNGVRGSGSKQKVDE